MMVQRFSLFLMLGLLFCFAATAAGAAPATRPQVSVEFVSNVHPFLQAHCVKCHGPTKQKGDFRVDDLNMEVSADIERWRRVADQLRDGTMPPEKEPRPAQPQIQAVLGWVAKSGHGVARLPNKGNLVPHEALFGRAPEPFEPPAARLWLLSPDGYLGFVREVCRGRVQGIVQPFTPITDRGIKDYASLYTIDEQSTQILIRNAEAIVAAQTACEIKDGKLRGKGDTVGEFVKLMDPSITPSRLQLETAVQLQFKTAIGRAADAETVDRLVGLYEKCAADGDRPAAVRTMLQAVLLKSEAMYRSELAASAAGGAAMLKPEELARALSLAIADRRDSALMQAASKGELATKEQIAAQVRRMLDDPKIEKPRILRFFREYFEYQRATDVFKDKPMDKTKHEPQILVNDTDRLVLYILAKDKDVLHELLTTPLTFANSAMKQNKQTRKDELVRASVLNPNNDKGARPVEAVYGFEEWPAEQPAAVPSETRIGILMQPSWLVAHSTNFDNDPVRRGRWIRERLLGGTVPDLPIGVAAQVPDEPDRTFRDRLKVTRQEQCWKCHRRMDDLGLAFENFDHYGRFRTSEKVLNPEATQKNVDKKGKPLGPVLSDAPLDTTGLVADSGDAALDGPVKDSREMIRRLAASDRVRQVFVRHAFRYFMGRNETLSDARTLQEADRAYVQSGGSFKSLIVSLLTSDSFLYRRAS
jgi:hypothetical protein